MKLLLTGFEPFGDSQVNPSEQVVCRLGETHLPGLELVPLILPVDYLRAPEKLLQAVEETRPQAVLCLGEASSRPVLSVERLAVNLLNFSMPDNQSAKIEDEPILPGGPAAYFVTLPVRKTFEVIRAAQVPVEFSLSAGSYLCNQVLYMLLNHLSRLEVEIPAGFIHLPPLPEQVAARKNPGVSMSLETSLRGIQAVVALLRETTPEARWPEAAISAPGLEGESFGQLTIRRATVDDIETLVALRLSLQREIGAFYGDVPAEGAAEVNRRYLARSLPSGEFLAWVAEDNEQIVACSGLVLYGRMPGMHGLSSREAYVMNMYTLPEYRRQGIATALLNRMVQYAKAVGAWRVWLRATQMGRLVYEKMSFQPMESALQLKLEG